MRSFIKHRRNESTTSEDSHEAEYARTTPVPSPNIHQNVQLTPPQALPSSGTNSISSPKKLLTPIKNLFSSSSHFKSATNLSSYSNDNLNNAIYGASPASSSSAKPSKRRPLGHRRNTSSTSSIPEFHVDFGGKIPAPSTSLMKPGVVVSNQPVLPRYKSTDAKSDGPMQSYSSLAPPPSFIEPSRVSPSQNKSYSETRSFSSQPSLSQQSSESPAFTLSSSNNVRPPSSPLPGIPHPTSSPLLPTRRLNDDLHLDAETASLNGSTTGNTSKQVSFHNVDADSANDQSETFSSKAPTRVSSKGKANNQEHESTSDKDEDDDEDEYYDSETSSQFSFIKDRKGGRNTSVKYYKAVKQSPQNSEEEAGVSNTFNENDLGYEVDEFSDYDFENNGMADEDFGDEIGEDFESHGADAYNKLFDDMDEDTCHLNTRTNDDIAQRGNESTDRDDPSVEALTKDYEQKGGIHEYEEEDPHLNDDESISHDEGDDDLYNCDEYDQYPPSDQESANVPHEDTTLVPAPVVTDPSMSSESNETSQLVLDPGVLSQLKTYKPYNNSYHLSIQGPPKSSPDHPEENEKDLGSPLHSEVNEVDILENYLDLSRSPSTKNTQSSSSFEVDRQTPDLSAADNLQLYDLNSPIINGLTIGSTTRYKTPRRDINNKLDVDTIKYDARQQLNDKMDDDLDDRDRSDDESKVMKIRALKSYHSSIDEGLNIDISQKVQAMESFVESMKAQGIKTRNNDNEGPKEKENTESIGLGITGDESTNASSSIASNGTTFDKTTRSSIVEMMDLLGSLESTSASLEKLDDENTSSKKQKPGGNAEKRKSVLGMMDFLANMESNLTKENDSDVDVSSLSTQPNSQPNTQQKSSQEARERNRKSIADMMSNLAILETSMNDKSVDSKTKRKSITNMMATLAKLDQDNELNAFETAPKTHKQPKNALGRLRTEAKKDASKRYSWFNNDETINFKTASNPTKSELVEKEGTSAAVLAEEEHPEFGGNYPFDQELLDEVNQMPEDFDFEEHEYHHKAQQLVGESGFYRSNSYNKKPVKAIIDNSCPTNKIETLNKTVTFYRSNSRGRPLEISKSRSISRAPSGRSLTSFTSLNEEGSLEEEAEEILDSSKSTLSSNQDELVKKPYMARIDDNVYAKSAESFSSTSNNLDTITEADGSFYK